MLRVDREYYVDEAGKTKYRQPGTTDIIRFADGYAAAHGDDQSPIAVVTSATYQPSREVAAALASSGSERTIGVATYGTRLLAEVKGGDAPAPAPINQLPGEFYKLTKEVAKLQAELNKA